MSETGTSNFRHPQQLTTDLYSIFSVREMDGVVHNPDILQVSNEADLSMGVDTINSVEHNVYMGKRAENQEADIQVLFFLPTYI